MVRFTLRRGVIETLRVMTGAVHPPQFCYGGRVRCPHRTTERGKHEIASGDRLV
jgi:hypothetical protein